MPVLAQVFHAQIDTDRLPDCVSGVTQAFSCTIARQGLAVIGAADAEFYPCQRKGRTHTICANESSWQLTCSADGIDRDASRWGNNWLRSSACRLLRRSCIASLSPASCSDLRDDANGNAALKRRGELRRVTANSGRGSRTFCAMTGKLKTSVTTVYYADAFGNDRASWDADAVCGGSSGADFRGAIIKGPGRRSRIAMAGARRRWGH